MAAVCFGLWVAIGFQVLANAGKTDYAMRMLFGKGVQVPVSECQDANRRTDRMVFPKNDTERSYFILAHKFLYEVYFINYPVGTRTIEEARFGITCFKSEILE